jgi:hypothetical protein
MHATVEAEKHSEVISEAGDCRRRLSNPVIVNSAIGKNHGAKDPACFAQADHTSSQQDCGFKMGRPVTVATMPESSHIIRQVEKQVPCALALEEEFQVHLRASAIASL